MTLRKRKSGKKVILFAPSHSRKRLMSKPVLRDIEREDELWIKSGRKKLQSDAVTGNHMAPVTEGSIDPAANNSVEKEGSKPKRKSNAPRGFY